MASATAGTARKPVGDRVAAESLSLNGQRIDPAAGYRVTVNNFLAVGGDGFTVFTEGTAPQVGVYDVDALYAYFRANSPIAPDHDRSHHANELNCRRYRRPLLFPSAAATPLD